MSQPPAVSVIIPCYESLPWLETCIGSLAAQTLPRESFEAVLVFNGDDDGGEARAVELLGEAGIAHQILHSDPGAPTARNVGTQHAAGQWHTFLDIDDAISPNYLEALLESATDPKVVPVATMLDVRDGEPTASAAHNQIMAVEGIVSPAECWRPMTITVVKLIPADVSRRHPFNTALRSGEDVALFFSMFEEEELDFDTTPAHKGATYFRTVRSGSVSRQAATYDFMVSQRLQVMEQLERPMVRDGERRLDGAVQTIIDSQADMVRLFLSTNLDRVPEALAEIEERGLKRFPWRKIPQKTDRLIVSYCFAPFADPSALVSIKRAIMAGHRYNAISVDMSDRRKPDPTIRELAEEVVVQSKTVPGPSAFEDWAGIEAFTIGGMDALAEIEALHVPQRHMYSRAMFPASHFLGALIKGRRPEVEWTAEFSDPLRKNVFGTERPGPVWETPVSTELAGYLKRAGFPVREEATVFEWAETLAFALADTLVFTNPHQLSHMLGYLDGEALRERVMERAVITPQPILPPEYYERGTARSPLDPTKTHLAYFGSFYPTRGLGDVLEGLRRLTPEQAGNIRIHVFTSNQDALAKALEGHPYRSSVVAYFPLPYLHFLAATKDYDVLLINDARTLDTPVRVNPYLPSKLSDYLGSGRPVWGMVEAGSMLSRQPLAYRTRLGNTAEAAALLARLVAERPSE